MIPIHLSEIVRIPLHYRARRPNLMKKPPASQPAVRLDTNDIHRCPLGKMTTIAFFNPVFSQQAYSHIERPWLTGCADPGNPLLHNAHSLPGHHRMSTTSLYTVFLSVSKAFPLQQ